MSQSETGNSAPDKNIQQVAGAPAQTNAPLFWSDARQLRILCLVNTPRGVDAGELHDGVCERARAVVARVAPMPVSIVGLGDPEILKPDTITMLVHVAITGNGADRLAALTVRPFRNAPDGGGQLFGAAPRAVRAGTSDRAALAAIAPELETALTDTLPWKARN
ncbi:hypothetical protein [Sphingopyxis sp.]|uniref:hypothetical protein n=1 Tax=Sphingopyxis sp. TaxID=1908224 RepID=UPI002B46040D|nr:hypothetical protein [Sphingopyxis sp.]